MVLNILYRRPSFVPGSSRASVSSVGSSVLDKGALEKTRSGIPEALSFDSILAGKTCPPCTTRDFMNYLLYIEFAAENLQFYLWLQDYEKRFQALDVKNSVLSPEWDEKRNGTLQSEVPPTPGLASPKANPGGTVAKQLLAGTSFGPKGTSRITIQPSDDTLRSNKNPNPFDTPPRTPNGLQPPMTEAADIGKKIMTWAAKEIVPSHAEETAEAFNSVDLKWQPFTIQPFREEISRVIALYIAEGSLRELNLSTRERIAVLHALEHTTHPSAFRQAKASVEWTLRFQAHPNFIRWTICNGNRPRVIFARGLGLGAITLGMVAAVFLSLSGAGKGWRALAAIGWMIGIATLWAAWKGMCVVLHGLHRRHIRPWELWANEASVEMKAARDSFNYLQPESNSYEDQPWVTNYKKRNIIRKVFDRETWIEEPSLRQIQDTIFLQAICVATISSGILVAIFVMLPPGNLF